MMVASVWLSLFCIAASVLRLSANAFIRGNETDRLALLALKDQMNSYPPGSYMSSWNNSNDFCHWEGVTCSRRHHGRVVQLNLRSQGLTGSISPYIGNLSFLRNISLANNTLHGEIPQEIGRLFRLRVLHIYNNSLLSPVPVNLSHCTNLEELVLHHNLLTGKIPELSSCTKLRYLSLSRNNLTGRIPVSLGNLTSLSFIDLQNNHLDGSIPSSLSQLKQLRVLALSDNNLSGKVPPLLYNISSLEQIFLIFNQLEGRLPHDIGLNLPLLTSFSLWSNKFIGPIPVSLFSNSSSIQTLDLGKNNFTGNVPVEIGRLKHLVRLSLSRNFLGSGGKSRGDLDFLTSLNNCSNLRYVGISFNQFGGNLPASVSNLSVSLESLYIGINQITGSIPSEIGNLVGLTAFSAAYNFLTGGIPSSIGKSQNLQQLDFIANRLSGLIPYSIGNITSLYAIGLSDNMLSGNIITAFEKCRNLQTVELDSNNLTGVVPKQVLGFLNNLIEVNLSRNHLSGSLPLEVGNLKNLNWLDVSENEIAGEIPRTLGDCVILEGLYLQGNVFQGTVPVSFTNLKGIQVIDLSRNNLSGEIPKHLQDLVYLRSLNLSFNDFDGEVSTRGVFMNVSGFAISGNSKLCGGITELHLLKCITSKPKHNGLPLGLKVTLGVVLPSLLITSLLLMLYLRNKSTSKLSSEALPESNLQRVSYNELRDATNDFSSENLIGVGSYGSVYKGVLRTDGTLIAVKVLNLIMRGASRSFMAECEILRRVRHRNLLKILTVCSSIDYIGNDFKALVYRFMSNGSLDSWLHSSSDRPERPSDFLNLLQRLDIAIDIASALDYLHNYGPAPIIHCDIKPSNVLLDDDMVAYVGDFGLARFLHKSTSNSDNSQSNSIAVRGTIGYIPPEYGMGAEVTPEGDLYSYGIMLLEMFTGRRPTDEMFKDNLSLHSFCRSNTTDRLVEIIDIHLLVEESTNESATGEIEERRGLTNSMKECLISILEVGVASSSESTTERMGIKDVLPKMHKIKEAFVSKENLIER